MLDDAFPGGFALLVKAFGNDLFSRRYVHGPKSQSTISACEKPVGVGDTNLAAPKGLGRLAGLLWLILGEASGDGVVEVFPERGKSSNFRRASWGVGGVDDDATPSCK
jgi:hypothetical protein